MPVGTPADVSSSRNILDTFKQTGWRCSSRQFCYCVIGGLDVAQRIRCWPQAFRFMPPRSGLSRSDFVLWPDSADLGDAASRQLSGGDRPSNQCSRHAARGPIRSVQSRLTLTEPRRLGPAMLLRRSVKTSVQRYERPSGSPRRSSWGARSRASAIRGRASER
jgi:hypothetical protein